MDSENVLHLIVEVGLHENCMKGRPGYRSGVRPNHWIPGREYTFIGQLDFLEQDSLAPGNSCKADGRFIIDAQDRELFIPGFAWHLCEANKIVGYARVVEVINT